MKKEHTKKEIKNPARVHRPTSNHCGWLCRLWKKHSKKETKKPVHVHRGDCGWLCRLRKKHSKKVTKKTVRLHRGNISGRRDSGARGQYRLLSGKCNNLRYSDRGAANSPFLLLSGFLRSDREIQALPDARYLSNTLSTEKKLKPNRRRMSELVTFFGQLIDHTSQKQLRRSERIALGLF